MNAKHTLAFLLILILLLLPVAAVQAGPLSDGGGFPTATPTVTPLIFPTATWTSTPQGVVVTLQPVYPAPTGTVASLYPGPSSNVQEGEQPAAETSGTNPLITAAYIGLFIFLVVGIWMLFGRRGMRP